MTTVTITTKCQICNTTYVSKIDKNLIHYPNACSWWCFLIQMKNVPIIKQRIILKENKNFNKPKFRSNLEKKVYQKFKDNKIDIYHEPFLVNINDKIFYVPDFYLPQYSIFIEAKGKWTKDGYTKFVAFKEYVSDLGYRCFLFTENLLRRYK